MSSNFGDTLALIMCVLAFGVGAYGFLSEYIERKMNKDGEALKAHKNKK